MNNLLEKHLKNQGCICPYCDSDEIRGDGTEYNTQKKVVTEFCVCENCKGDWTNEMNEMAITGAIFHTQEKRAEKLFDKIKDVICKKNGMIRIDGTLMEAFNFAPTFTNTEWLTKMECRSDSGGETYSHAFDKQSFLGAVSKGFGEILIKEDSENNPVKITIFEPVSYDV